MSLARLVELFSPIKVAPANQTTTNAYVVVAGSEIDARNASKIAYSIYNAHAANGLTWKVMAGVDGSTYPKEAQAEAAVAAEGSGTFEASATVAAYPYFAVYVKSTVAETPATADVHGFAKP